jgi:NADH-quinone oxidoreductase subunit N
MNYGELLKLLAPESILALTLLLVLGADATFLSGRAPGLRRAVAASLTVAGCMGAIYWIFFFPIHGHLFSGVLVVDPLTQVTKQVLLLLTAATALLTLETAFTPHVGEYFGLQLLATLGFLFMVSSEDILTIFVALELASLSLYMLASFAKGNLASAEAGLKYFLYGGLASAFLLFGFSLLYGLTGETLLAKIAAKITTTPRDPLLVVAISMVLTGLGFKIAAVPFQLWAPDVYEGAPTPSAALIASGSKLASFFLLEKMMTIGLSSAVGSGAFHALAAGWVPMLAMLAGLSLIVGNLTALAQTSVKRLLAYSAIAHAGYALLGVIANSSQGFVALLFYVMTYGFTVLGAFGVVAVVERQTGSDRLEAFAGLSRRSPVLAGVLFVCLLSLAGIPPLAGFFGKFYLFAAILRAGAPSLGILWLVILAIALSAVSLFYYLQVLKQAFVREAPLELPFSVKPSTQLVLILLALCVILFGCAPDLLVSKLLLALKAAAPGLVF